MGTNENARAKGGSGGASADENLAAEAVAGRVSGMVPSIEKQGHPRGLFTLFGAEAWERFSYYGMRALLVLYLTDKLKFDRAHALEIYGLYTGLVYLTPLLGGYLADKLLGRRKAVCIGGIVMALGQVALMFPPTLYLALGLLIAGNGFFKPNISTMVGGLYREGDTRRDGAFTIFYMGINLGALWSPLICGTLGESHILSEEGSFALGFGSAAIGMTLGLVQFVFGQKFLGDTGLPPGAVQDKASLDVDMDAGKGTLLTSRDYLDVVVWTVGTCALVKGVLVGWDFAGPAWGAVPGAVKTILGIGAISVVFFQLFKGSNGQEAQQLGVIIILCAFNIFFWMGFEQAGGTMTLFAKEQTNRDIGGLGMVFIALFIFVCAFNFFRETKDQVSGRTLWRVLTGMFVVLGVGALGMAGKNFVTGATTTIPASQFQAINPFLIVALAPSFSNMWSKLDTSKYRTSTPTKMAIGMVILGLGFVVLYAGQTLAESTHTKASAAWLVGVYTIHTIGELCLSPIGLSMVTKLAPARVSSLAMGLWLGSTAVANYLAGTLESLLGQWHLPIYAFLAGSSIGPALLLLAVTPLLKKWMHGKA